MLSDLLFFILKHLNFTGGIKFIFWCFYLVYFSFSLYPFTSSPNLSCYIITLSLCLCGSHYLEHHLLCSVPPLSVTKFLLILQDNSEVTSSREPSLSWPPPESHHPNLRLIPTDLIHPMHIFFSLPIFQLKFQLCLSSLLDSKLLGNNDCISVTVAFLAVIRNRDT